MYSRFILTVAVTGVVSAAAFVPWSTEVRTLAAQGQQADLTLAYAGYFFAFLAWMVAGGLTTRRPLARPWLVGLGAGFVSAGISAWLVWLPTVNVWSLAALWAMAVGPEGTAGEGVIGQATSDLLHYSVLGFWGHSVLGAVGGLIGTAATRTRGARPQPRVPVLWPLRMWVWAVAFVAGGVVALQQTQFEVVWVQAIGKGRFDPLELLLINGAVLGVLTAAPLGATGVRYARSDLPTLRRLGLILYLGIFVMTLGLWCGVVPVFAPSVLESSVLYVAYCAAPVVAALIGVALGWRDPQPPIPRARDMFAEMALLGLVTGPLVVGAGLGGAAWSSVVGPLVWANVLSGVSKWSSVEQTISEVLGMQAFAWLPILGVVLLESTIVILPALMMIRWSALKQAEVRNAAKRIEGEPTAELTYDATVPRMALSMFSGGPGQVRVGNPLVDRDARTVSNATEVDDSEVELQSIGDELPPTEAFDGKLLSPADEEDNVATERLGSVDSSTRVTSASRD